MTNWTFAQSNKNSIRFWWPLPWVDWSRLLPDTDLLLLLTLLLDVFVPFLVWKGYAPGFALYLSQITLAPILLIAIIRMLVFDRIPPIFFVVAQLTILGGIVATAEGQSLRATAWGWWAMFEFPLVGFYIYLSPRPVMPVLKYVAKFVFVLTILILGVQILQFLGGTPVGDHLAGLFGRHGVAKLFIFTFLALSLYIGRWLVDRSLFWLLSMLLITLISNVLAENKIFAATLPILGFASLMIYGYNERKLLNILPYIVGFAAILILFVYAYNYIVPAGVRPIESYLDTDNLYDYLFQDVDATVSTTSTVDIRRGFAMLYGWQTISKDTISQLFGFGIGARTESIRLGIIGVALLRGDFGLTRGTNLLVLMQEIGLTGLAILNSFFIGLILYLWRGTRRFSEPMLDSLRYGMILFTLFLPFFIWYSSPLDMRVPMLFYWGLVGALCRSECRKAAS